MQAEASPRVWSSLIKAHVAFSPAVSRLSNFHVQMAAAGVRDSAADHACSHLGKAVAIATILRGTGHHAQRCFDVAAAASLATHHLSSYLLMLQLTWLRVSCRFASMMDHCACDLMPCFTDAGDDPTCLWTCAPKRCACKAAHLKSVCSTISSRQGMLTNRGVCLQGVSQEEIYRGKSSEALSSVVYDVACVAKVCTVRRNISMQPTCSAPVQLILLTGSCSRGVA